MVKMRNIVLSPQKGGASVMRMPPQNMMEAVVMEPRRRPSRSATMESTSMPACMEGGNADQYSKHKMGVYILIPLHARAHARQEYMYIKKLECERQAGPHTMIPANSLYEIVCNKL